MTKLFRILILGLLLWSVPASAQRTAPKPEKVHNVILMIGDGMGCLLYTSPSPRD